MPYKTWFVFFLPCAALVAQANQQAAIPPEGGVYHQAPSGWVRSNRKQDYRELRMPVSDRITQWTRFRDKDVSEIEMEPLFPDVVRVRPHADLKPGEYVIVSDLEPRYLAMRLGFEFGVLSGASRP